MPQSQKRTKCHDVDGEIRIQQKCYKGVTWYNKMQQKCHKGVTWFDKDVAKVL